MNFDELLLMNLRWTFDEPLTNKNERSKKPLINPKFLNELSVDELLKKTSLNFPWTFHEPYMNVWSTLELFNKRWWIFLSNIWWFKNVKSGNSVASRHLQFVQSRNNMEKIINIGIPHIGEQIFKTLGTSGLVQLLSVSKTWKVLIEEVLFERYYSSDDGDPCFGFSHNHEYHKYHNPLSCLLMSNEDSRVQIKVVKIIFENTKNHKHINFIGREAFLAACRKGNTKVAKLLIEYSNQKVFEFDENLPYFATQSIFVHDKRSMVEFFLELLTMKLKTKWLRPSLNLRWTFAEPWIDLT